MKTAGVIVLIIILLLVAGGVGWVVFTRKRAQRLGLPPPSLGSYIPFVKSSSSPYGLPQPAPGGIVGWINDRVRMFRNRNARTAVGAYEQASGRPGGRRGFGPLDPDEAWDARVGHEADTYGPGGFYEEQELGLGGGAAAGRLRPDDDTSYGGSTYAMNLAATPGDEGPAGFPGDDGFGRGRTRSRSPGRGLAPGATSTTNPFGDDADPSNISLRSVSPRPLDTAAAVAASGGGKSGQKDDSPTERRSVFREDV